MFGLFKKAVPTIDFDKARRDLYGAKSPKPLVEDTAVIEAQARAQAKRHVDDLMKRAESEVTDPLLTAAQRTAAVNQRYDELCDQESIVRAYIDRENRLQGNHEELIATLEHLTAEVRRGATAANLMDAAKAHPFLTGVIGTHLYQSLTSK